MEPAAPTAAATTEPTPSLREQVHVAMDRNDNSVRPTVEVLAQRIVEGLRTECRCYGLHARAEDCDIHPRTKFEFDAVCVRGEDLASHQPAVMALPGPFAPLPTSVFSIGDLQGSTRVCHQIDRDTFSLPFGAPAVRAGQAYACRVVASAGWHTRGWVRQLGELTVYPDSSQLVPVDLIASTCAYLTDQTRMVCTWDPCMRAVRFRRPAAV